MYIKLKVLISSILNRFRILIYGIFENGYENVK
jgi:hypothetical protein